MLYNLFDYLKDFTDFPGLGLLRYISFRATTAIILALFIALFVGKKIINNKNFYISCSLKFVKFTNEL